MYLKELHSKHLYTCLLTSIIINILLCLFYHISINHLIFFLGPFQIFYRHQYDWFSYDVMFDSCYPMDYSLLGSSVPGISQARIQDGVTISCSRGSSQPRVRICISCTGRRFFTTKSPGKPLCPVLCDRFYCEINVWNLCHPEPHPSPSGASSVRFFVNSRK